MSLKTCPDRQSLQQLLLGKMPRPQAEPLEEHLLHCDQCSVIADTISASDELTVAIQSPDVAYGEDEIVARIIERGKRIRCQTETSETGETIIGKDGPQPENATATYAGDPGTDLDEVTDFLAPAEQPDEIGRLGDFRVLEVLGVGGIGIVFLAEDPQLERLVALKAMKPRPSGRLGTGSCGKRKRPRRSNTTTSSTSIRWVKTAACRLSPCSICAASHYRRA